MNLPNTKDPTHIPLGKLREIRRLEAITLFINLVCFLKLAGSFLGDTELIKRFYFEHQTINLSAFCTNLLMLDFLFNIPIVLGLYYFFWRRSLRVFERMNATLALHRSLAYEDFLVRLKFTGGNPIFIYGLTYLYLHPVEAVAATFIPVDVFLTHLTLIHAGILASCLFVMFVYLARKHQKNLQRLDHVLERLGEGSYF